MKKKMIAVAMALALILSAVSVTPSMTTYAKTKSPKLSKKKMVMTVGKVQKVKLKNVSQKVKWTVAKKKVVKITKKSGKYNNSIVIKGVKTGSTKIIAKCGKKKYKVKVTVKKEETPSKEVEGTTAEEIPEQTAENHTTEAETTPKPTAEGTETEELTTSEQLSETPTINEETTEPETTRETKLVAEVLNNVITTEDTLWLNIYFNGPTDVILWTDYNPYILEIYEDGQWRKLEYSDNFEPIMGMPTISENLAANINISLFWAYKDVRPGHYRYTHHLGKSTFYDGENPYGDSISVEFDIIDSEFCITGKVKKDDIENTDNLEITYNVFTESEKEYIYDTQPNHLYQDINGRWVECIPILTSEEHEYQTMIGSGNIDITIPLAQYFGSLSPRLYRYVHMVAGKEILVSFYVRESVS